MNVSITTYAEWLAEQKADGQCSCLNCWHRYAEYFKLDKGVDPKRPELRAEPDDRIALLQTR